MRYNKNTTLKQFIFSDYDGDGAKNIDDPYPFDPKRKYPPTYHEDPKYGYRSQYADREVLLSQQLKRIEKNNNAHAPLMHLFLRQNPRAKGRVKSVPSTIQKLNRYGLHRVSDAAAVKVVSKNRATSRRDYLEAKRRYHTRKSLNDNFYRNPKAGVYYAYHAGITKRMNGKIQIIEAQYKSVPMDKLALQMHGDYKKGKRLDKYKRKARRLFEKGY